MSICYIMSIFLMIFSVSMFMFMMYMLFMDYCLFIELELLSINSNSIVMTLLIDWMSLIFMSFVTFISSMVIYYSSEYMSGDININRFIMLVMMFVLSMILLIISPNLISILLGWDGLGLVSYCLVIYYQNEKSYNAGMLTALSNRIGDVMLLMAIVWMMNYGSWNYIFYLDCMKNDLFMKIIGVLVILAAITKSAQIPFSSWLPAAMAAPTPVSSLVHSSTLVTAGVYLLIRFSSCLSEGMLKVLLLISVLTMFMAGLGANFEYDLKKIIALSTLSQLGLMMSILCLGNYFLAFFHLLTHALFKALLFMCAGNIIHSVNNNQDIRNMGNLLKFMPLTCCYFNIANLSLCGMPFLAGFYSKDLILEFMSMNYINILIYLLFFVSTGFTVSYSLRLSYYSLIKSFNFYSLNCLNEKSYIMLKSMFLLVMMVIFGGSMLLWMLMPSPLMICLPIYMKLMTLFVCIMGGWIGYSLSKMEINWILYSLKYYYYVYYFGSMWFMPNISTFSMNFYPLILSKMIFKNIDQGWNEYFGAQGIYMFLKKNTLLISFIQNNNLKIFLLLFIMFIMILFLLMF
uniref:NADH-ubiquinone oxidoreductase chain 5 n=1 Tax=Sphaerius sp. BT0074 TaxID=546487 RepID=B6D8V1_9COLE|nr:NADH dehydrogenase subunit 5 [Sphaerius sp. BT0074]ACF35089.1 NADH dehydrogenase subunit 5 [Sphaerius sp. BT0074]